MRCNKVLLIGSFCLVTLLVLLLFQISNNIQTTQFKNHKTEWGWPEDLHPLTATSIPGIEVGLTGRQRDLGLEK